MRVYETNASHQKHRARSDISAILILKHALAWFFFRSIAWVEIIYNTNSTNAHLQHALRSK